MVADMGFDAPKLAMLEQAYRMVGRREAGWKFDPAKVPMYLMTPLVGEYAEYLREAELPEDAKTYEALFTELAGMA